MNERREVTRLNTRPLAEWGAAFDSEPPARGCL